MKRPGPIRSGPGPTRDLAKLRAWEERTREKARAKARSGLAPTTALLSPAAHAESAEPRRSQKPTRRYARINARNAERRAKEFERAYGGAVRVEWAKRRPYRVCGQTPTDVCHVVSGGMGRKADASLTTELCRAHHESQHHLGTRAFEALHAVDLAALAVDTERAWLAFLSHR